jgi:hypothetical protein
MPFETINIFVDLDETLIHTLGFKTVAGDIEQVEELCDKPVTVSLNKNEHYTIVLRPGANYLLYRLREIGKVYMLTRAAKDYAQAVNKAFNFGFDEDKIFDRQYVVNWKHKTPKIEIPNGKCVLIDDLLARDNFEKIAFIKRFGTAKYINVPAFWGERGNEFTSSYIQEIIQDITNA